MNKYLVSQSDEKKVILQKEVKRSYSFNANGNSSSEFKSITIYDKKLINKMLSKKVIKKIIDINNLIDEDSDEGNILALDALNTLLLLLRDKYQKYLSKKTYELFLEEIIKLRDKASYNLTYVNDNSKKGR